MNTKSRHKLRRDVVLKNRTIDIYDGKKSKQSKDERWIKEMSVLYC